MSGLLERIVRRRRASASRRLGPPSSSGAAAEGNGRADLDVNGAASADPAILALHAARREVSEPTPLESTAEAPHAPAPAQAQSEDDAPEPLAAPDHPSDPGFLERGRMRRRARYLRRLREVQMRDIGGFVVELNRFGREREELVQAKVESAAHTDAELRALERALNERHPLGELRLPGIGGACPVCGAVHGSDDRFCASCGEPLRDDDSPPEEDPLEYRHVYPE